MVKCSKQLLYSLTNFDISYAQNCGFQDKEISLRYVCAACHGQLDRSFGIYHFDIKYVHTCMITSFQIILEHNILFFFIHISAKKILNNESNTSIGSLFQFEFDLPHSNLNLVADDFHPGLYDGIKMHKNVTSQCHHTIINRYELCLWFSHSHTLE